jgi:hypothetical protein
VHGDLDETLARLERHLDLAEVVVRVGVVEGEADQALDHRAQPPLVLSRNPSSGRKRRHQSRHQRRRAAVAQHGDLHPSTRQDSYREKLSRMSTRRGF